MNRPLLICLLAAMAVTCPAAAEDIYVSPRGSDANPGTQAAPLATIQKAADLVSPGDRVFILPGRYRETVTLKTSGTADAPIQFIAAPGGPVVIDGTDPLQGQWQRHKGNIWRIAVDGPQIEQVFADDVMQHEARWPDMPFEKRWDRKFWGQTGQASEYGKLEAKGLGATGVDWTGAIALLNVGHQFFTWSRNVTSHEKGSDFFTYDRDLPGLAFLDPKTGIEAQGGKVTPWIANQWKDDYFYLFGKLEALTVPTEWFHDTNARQFYYMPLGDGAPKQLSIKRRKLGMHAKQLSHIHLKGLTFFGCVFQFANCRHITIDDCHVRYPNFSRRVMASEQPQYKQSFPTNLLSGSQNVMRRSSVLFAGGTAMVIAGNNNTLENSIIRDGCWSGTLHYSLVKMHGKGNTLRRNEIGQAGAPLVHHTGANIIELNHIHQGGLLSEDVSAVYTSSAKARGAIIRYNWIHGVRTGHGLGQGIRGDDMTRGLIVHHNVVWDCGMVGIIVKGGENQIYNNTIFDVTNGKPRHKNRAGLIIPTQPEPRKPWKDYHKLNLYLDVQNADSVITNNLVDDIYYRHKKIESPAIHSNIEMKGKAADYLMDPKGLDFRLKPSALEKLPSKAYVPKGVQIDGLGAYVGAYAPEQPPWKPGPDWSMDEAGNVE